MQYKGFGRQQTLAPQSVLAELSQLPVPEAVEDEYGILSCIFNSYDAASTFREAANLLKPEHFVTPTLQDIWRGILKAHKENLPTEFRVQANYLQDFAQINSDVLKGVLNHISESLHDPDNITHYAERIVRKWESRELLGALASSARAALDASVSPEEALMQAEANLRQIRENMTSKSVSRSGTISELGDSIIGKLEKIAKGEESSNLVKTNMWHEFDQMGRGVAPGEIIVFAAPPGGGKTTSAAGIADAYSSQGIYTLWISLEDDPEKCFSKILSANAKISVSSIVDGSDIGIADIEKLKVVQEKKKKVGTLMCKQPLTMTIEGVEQAIADAESEMRKLHGEAFTGFRIIIYDYLQYLGKFVEPHIKTSYIDSLTVRLGHIAKKMGATLLAFAQYDTEIVKSGKRPEGFAFFADCKAIAQNADQIWALWSEGYAKPEHLHTYSTLEYICLKNRRGATGAITLGIKWAYGWIYSLLGKGSPNLYPADPAQTTTGKQKLKAIEATEETPEVIEDIPGDPTPGLEEFEEDLVAKYNDPDLEVVSPLEPSKVTLEAEVHPIINKAAEETVGAKAEEAKDLSVGLLGEFEVGEEVIFKGHKVPTPAKILGVDETDPLLIRIEFLDSLIDEKSEYSGKKYLREKGEVRSVTPGRLIKKILD